MCTNLCKYMIVNYNYTGSCQIKTYFHLRCLYTYRMNVYQYDYCKVGFLADLALLIAMHVHCVKLGDFKISICVKYLLHLLYAN